MGDSLDNRACMSLDLSELIKLRDYIFKMSMDITNYAKRIFLLLDISYENLAQSSSSLQLSVTELWLNICTPPLFPGISL